MLCKSFIAAEHLTEIDQVCLSSSKADDASVKATEKLYILNVHLAKGQIYNQGKLKATLLENSLV